MVARRNGKPMRQRDVVGLGERGGGIILELDEWRVQPWRKSALCAELDSDEADRLFFPQRGQTGTSAREICGRCPVRGECLGFALSNVEGAYGVWGGTTAKERNEIRRRQATSEPVASPDQLEQAL